MHTAALFDRPEIVKLLLDKGADLHARTVYGDTPVHIAARSGSEYTLEVLSANGADLHATNEKLTVLHMAMMADQKEMVRYLIGKGFKVSPIHLAAFFGELQKAQSVLADGDSINSKDNAGFTPLHCAVCGGHKKVAEFLIAKGADVNAKDKGGRTALMYSVDNTDMAALLIARGANVNIKSEINRVSALHLAVERGDTKLVELLLSHGADVNAKASRINWQGWTPLHIACERWWNEAIVEMLLAKGAEVNAKTDEGDTPLSLAKGQKVIVELLRKHGAKE
jgi:ankyrin repeat protein